MYEEFFGFSGSPFRLAPDPKFFFGSKSHNKAMSYLHYGLRQAEGFIVVTGEIGAGKSILIGHLLDQLDRSNVLAADLVTPNVAAEDLLSHILSAFRIEAAGEGKAAEIDAFEDFLFDQMNQGRRCLLIVDEAQNLPTETLEELRVLSNLHYDGTPLFQVFLVGQPDFRDTMARSDMEQLRQRVIASYHLDPMTRVETEKYIEHRLAFVGWSNDPKFTGDAFDAIYAATGGVPRKIHKLCNRVLLYCSVEKSHLVDGSIVSLVLSDMSAEQARAGAPKTDADAEDLDAVAALNAVKQAGEQPRAEEPPPVLTAPPPPAMEEIAEALAASVAPPIVEAPVPEATAPEVATKEARETAPPTHVETAAPLSVFDRLRARKSASTDADDADLARPPRAATLDDVATAIAAARAAPAKAAHPVEPADSVEEPAELPPAVNDGGLDEDFGADGLNGWRKTAALSITETRNELSRAQQSVAKLRKQLTDLDKRRNKRRKEIAASLERAQTLLSEFQNNWR